MDESQELTAGAVESITRGEVDIQVLTARRFPRDIEQFKKAALALATASEETAESCYYVLKRKEADGGQKLIQGPSARFAEIVASTWKNMRIEGRPIGEDDQYTTSRGTAWDIENNVLVAFETRRRITNRQGKKFGDDMIAVTANAATAIALRNSVLKCVPKPFWQPIYEACLQKVKGNLKSLAAIRRQAIEHFQKLGVSKEQILATLEVKTEEEITQDHIVILRGISNAIKDGEQTLEEAFAREPIKAPQEKAEPLTATDTSGNTANGDQQSTGPRAAETDKNASRKKKEKAEEDAYRLLKVWLESAKDGSLDAQLFAVPNEFSREINKVTDSQKQMELVRIYQKRREEARARKEAATNAEG